VLLRDGLLEFGNDRVEAYGPYVELMQELAGALEMELEDLEGLCTWIHERSAEPVSSDSQGKGDDSEPAPEGPRVWLIAPGRRASAWEAHYAAGVAAIGWERLGDLREYRSVEEVNAKLRALRDDGRNPFNVARACFNFAHRMKPGDIVFAKRGQYEIVGAGVVTGEYEHAPHHASKDDPFVNRRRVRWIHKGSGRPRDKALVLKTLTDITAHTGLVRACAEVFDTTIEDIADAAGRPMPGDDDIKGEGLEPATEPEPYTDEHALAELFLDKEDLDDMLALLRGRLNVVLQGPPGTGKTFLAACLARLLIGSRSEKQVCRVQFHQSMTYEDFVQGYRPDGTGFALRTGPFLRFCNLAMQDRENTYVLIIDEINRGNLSRILGELMLLIEHDKRKPEWAVTLAYAGADDEPTWVPENLYIIGTMNTADRSLALVDYALRRRFAFIDVESAVSHPRFRAHLQARGVDSTVLDWIVKRIPELNGRICDDANLGRGFVIGHSYFCGGGTDKRWYERVIRHEIVPLLREYWFDARAQVEDSKAKLLDVD
jgi:5-methylcytosine-specific restriction enzyme B